jgi:hypothetical protein
VARYDDVDMNSDVAIISISINNGLLAHENWDRMNDPGSRSRGRMCEHRELPSHCALRQRIEILHEGAHGSINPGNLCIGGIDQIVLIRSVCAGSVA